MEINHKKPRNSEKFVNLFWILASGNQLWILLTTVQAFSYSIEIQNITFSGLRLERGLVCTYLRFRLRLLRRVKSNFQKNTSFHLIKRRQNVHITTTMCLDGSSRRVQRDFNDDETINLNYKTSTNSWKRLTNSWKRLRGSLRDTLITCSICSVLARTQWIYFRLITLNMHYL